MQMTLECEQEADGRWLAEVPQLPGVIAYGTSANQAMVKAQALALRILAERLEYGELLPDSISMTVPPAPSH
jgi:predicted RNase H-like HicB family nuclease